MTPELKKGILWSARVVHGEKKRLEGVRAKAAKKKDIETEEECSFAEDILERVEEILKEEASKNGVLSKVNRRGKPL